MKVYSVKGDGDYCGGVAIVAANNAKEARQLASETNWSNGVWRVRYDQTPIDSVIELDCLASGSMPRVIEQFEYGE